MHFRNAYGHVALVKLQNSDVFQTVAHELTHSALSHLDLPQWLEEGLTQLFEHDLGNKPFALDPKEVREQKAYWRQEGLEQFWTGAGFSSPGDVQKYSYQLAEILLRLLLVEYQPRWFGFDRAPVLKLMNFLRNAQRDDYGEAAAREYLGLSLDEIAERSLGKRQPSFEEQAEHE